MSKRSFLEVIAGVLDGDFEMVSIVEDENDQDRVALLVKNSDASAVVGITLSSVRDTGIVRISSVVVENLNGDESTLANALFLVNDLNQAAPLGRWVHYPEMGTIQFEEEQLVMDGQEYDGEEMEVLRFLMTRIYATIDHLDDDILRRLGSGNLASEARPTWA